MEVENEVYVTASLFHTSRTVAIRWKKGKTISKKEGIVEAVEKEAAEFGRVLSVSASARANYESDLPVDRQLGNFEGGAVH